MDILEKLKLRQKHFNGIAKHLELDYPEKIYGEAADEITKLRAENEALRKDAERLAWYFSNTRNMSEEIIQLSMTVIAGESVGIDQWREALDQAMTGKEGE